MLISVDDLVHFWGISKPRRIIHVGAHAAEELKAYEDNEWGAGGTVWIEALPQQVTLVQEKILGRPHHQVIQAVAWDSSGSLVDFNLANNVESSSALDFAEHLDAHPNVKMIGKIQLQTTALGELDIWTGTRDLFLNLDIQGSELAALRGIGDRIHECAAIYCEVNTRELYKGVPLIGEIDSYLKGKGFRRVDEQIYKEYGWGDALYLPISGRDSSWPLRKGRRKASHLVRSTFFLVTSTLKRVNKRLQGFIELTFPDKGPMR